MNDQNKGWTNDVKKEKFPAFFKSKWFWVLSIVLIAILIRIIIAFV